MTIRFSRENNRFHMHITAICASNLKHKAIAAAALMLGIEDKGKNLPMQHSKIGRWCTGMGSSRG